MDTPIRSYSYYKELFRNTPRPFAFVDLDYFDENVRQILRRAGEKRIRIASKSVRCVALLQRVLQADPQYQGIMSFHPGDAVFLSQKGFNDILIAYPYWGMGELEAIAGELKQGKVIVSMVDSQAHVEQIGRAAVQFGVEFPLCLDVDMSSDFFFGLHFGVYRSSLDDAEHVRQIVEFIDARPGVRLVGLMGYEGQIAGVQDRVAGRTLINAVVPTLKKRSISELRARRAAVVQAARPERLRIVNAGGTGSLESSRQEACVTEVTVGSGFYSPTLFDGYTAFKHLPAAAFAIEIVRRPRPHIYTCLGGGYIASGSAGKDKQPEPYLPEGARLLENEGAGEVQTPVEYHGDERLEHGDPIFFRHAKAGELCERFTRLYLVSNGEIVDEAPTYRGEGMCFI